MADERERVRGDMVLAPNEFAFASDETKGIINAYVGPCKVSLSNTEQLVVFNSISKKFEPSSLEKAKQLFATAPEGWYIVMKNPAKEAKDAHPRAGTSSQLTNDLLEVGKKVNIPGPCSFPLWPGQMVKVVAGHRLRSNQYLVVRVYDAKAAEANFDKSLFAPVAPKKTELKPPDQAEQNPPSSEQPKSLLATGQLFIIRGTRVSFFIPPIGFEVVADEQKNFVREAVTLEQLEYCILLGENGQKQYRRGPDVVFPEPTESFLARDGSNKFRAYELNENSGLYIKVIAEYEDGENKRKYPVGEELFVTGRESMIYFPRAEHAIITYDGQDKHHAIAIPAGEGRFVINRETGSITIKKGPAMYLPDPRKEVVVRRVLDAKTVELWYPGNQEALEYNKNLGATLNTKTDFVTDQMARSTLGIKSMLAQERTRSSHIADDFARGTEYTPPRTITLNTKFDGVPSINVWTGYAVQVVSKSEERRVVTGPQNILMEYDETLEAMELSKGTPKSDKATLKTVFLKVLGNKVSDQVTAETKDFCKVQILLSYRVNFEGDPNKWFNVENYVKFLTDHARSLIRNAVKQCGIEEFYNTSIAIVRDTILGKPGDDNKRSGRSFEENGMRIYDVEVLEVSIDDATINGLLKTAQHAAVKETFEMAAQRRKLTFTEETENIERGIIEAKTETEIKKILTQGLKTQEQLKFDRARVDVEIQTLQEKLQKRLRLEEGENKLHAEQLKRTDASDRQKLSVEEEQLDQRIKELEAESNAVKEKLAAVSPALIAALQVFSDKELLGKVAESMAPIALLEGNSTAESLHRLVRGTALEDVVGLLKNGKTNGKAEITE